MAASPLVDVDPWNPFSQYLAMGADGDVYYYHAELRDGVRVAVVERLDPKTLQPSGAIRFHNENIWITATEAGIVATMYNGDIWRLPYDSFDTPSDQVWPEPPDRTELVSIYNYRVAFQDFQFGKGAAVGVIMMLINLAFALVYLSIGRKKKAR